MQFEFENEHAYIGYHYITHTQGDKMKKMVLVAALLSSAFAQAQTVNWQEQLAKYKSDLKHASNGQVYSNYFFYSGASVVTCSADVTLTAAVFVAETAPVVNGAVQIIATY